MRVGFSLMTPADLVEALIEAAGEVVAEDEKGTNRGADDARRRRNILRDEILSRLEHACQT